MHPIDLIVLVAYLAGITALGVWMARRVRSIGDYFMPRRFGKAMMTTFAFGTGTASDQAVSVAAETFRVGLAGIWWQWIWLPATPFYWLIAPIMRRLRAITTADVYELRYDRSVALLFSVVGIVGLSVKIGLLLKGSGALIEATTGGAVSADWAIPIITVLFVAYGTAGGLAAAIVTDFVQGILTILFSFLLLPFVMQAVGGMEGIRGTIDDPEMLSLVVPGEIGLFFVVMYAIQALMGIVAQPFIMGVCAAGRTEMDGRFGFMVGNILKRICTAAWSLTALAAVAWYISLGVDRADINPDHVFGDMAREFLPGVMPGLLGVFLASLVASVMSSCDAMMVSGSALATENIYKPIVRGRDPGHYVWVGRLASVAIVAGGIVFAWAVPDVITALNIWFRIAPMMGIAFWLGLSWRRTTPAGAWAVTLTGFACWWLAELPNVAALVARMPMAEAFGIVRLTSEGRLAIAEPWVIALYTGAAVIAGVVVSLATVQTPRERLDRFYTLTRTPIVAGERVEEPCTLPPGVEPANRPMLLTAGGLEIPCPSRTSVLGFVLGWVAVVGMVLGFLWLLGG
ncbi:sodium:solute symporter family protein [Tautonia rosea]|uniref:sodium:solute symporter family protein n=1 Tax=Tautonia rosea TaxID=2728037 RepID=UPI0014743FC2|nr:sodium:solute symporter family protein [Tautonia rosea]